MPSYKERDILKNIIGTTGNKTHRVVVWIFGVIGIIAVIAAVTIGVFHWVLSTEYTVSAHSEKFENLRL